MAVTLDDVGQEFARNPQFLARIDHLRRASTDALYWMQAATKTRDEQDGEHPFKPFPKYPYFKALHYLWETEAINFFEKSRTMMVSWFGAAECLHYAMRHQPSRVIFWAVDEDRALKLLEYCWVLWEQQDKPLQRLWPVTKPRVRQRYNKMEFAGGSSLIALPGKDPDKIRSEHATVLMLDEACFIDQGAEAFDVALASKVRKLLAVSSAAPSWFRKMTLPAKKVVIPGIG